MMISAPLTFSFLLLPTIIVAQFYSWQPSEKGCTSFTITSSGADGDYGICDSNGNCCGHQDGAYCFQGTLFDMPFSTSSGLTCSLSCSGTDGLSQPAISAGIAIYDDERNFVAYDGTFTKCGNSNTYTRSRGETNIQYDLNLWVDTYSSTAPPYSYSATLSCTCTACTECYSGCYDCASQGCSVACPPTPAPTPAPTTAPAPTSSCNFHVRGAAQGYLSSIRRSAESTWSKLFHW